MSFAIYDAGPADQPFARPRLYLDRDWPTEVEARYELAALLKHFPLEHPWRARLSVGQPDGRLTRTGKRGARGKTLT